MTVRISGDPDPEQIAAVLTVLARQLPATGHEWWREQRLAALLKPDPQLAGAPSSSRFPSTRRPAHVEKRQADGGQQLPNQRQRHADDGVRIAVHTLDEPPA